MSNTALCPQCKTVYQWRPEFSGKQVRCAKCNTVFTMLPRGVAEAAAVPSGGRSASANVCPYCGSRTVGKYCSDCGSRVRGVPDFDFASCRVPTNFIQQFPSEFDFSFEGSPEEQNRQRHLLTIYEACTRYNAELDEMARQLKYGGFVSSASAWRFNRIQIGRLVDELPAELPQRETIIARLWSVVSDVERASLQSHMKDAIQEIDDALNGTDAKKATKGIERLRELLNELHDSSGHKQLDDFLARLAAIEQRAVYEKLLVAYQKLLDKADKLAFQQDWKKSVKAYQECLFWLSRNDVPNKKSLEHTAQQKLSVAQAACSA